MSTEPRQLKRSVRFPMLLFYGVGTMVGGGFYALSGKVAGQVGMHAPLAFALSGLLALLCALSFAELSGRLPQAGGSARYVEHAYRKTWLSALVGWMIIATGVVSAATLAVATTGFLQDLVALPTAPTIAAVVVAMGVIAAWGIGEAVALVAVITVVEVGALLYIIVTGGGALAEFPARASEILLPADATIWVGIVGAAFLAFYSFIGFEDMVTLAEEVKDVRRALPAAVVISLAVTIALYLLVSTVAVLSVPPSELGAAGTPLARVVAGHGPTVTTAIVLISMVAGINGALVQVIMAARVAYGMARRGYAPGWFGEIGRTRTPLNATAAATGLILVLALFFTLTTLAQLTSAIILAVFTLVNFGLWLVKGREPVSPQDVPNYPRALPLIGAVASAGLLVFQLSKLLAA